LFAYSLLPELWVTKNSLGILFWSTLTIFRVNNLELSPAQTGSGKYT